MRLTEILQRECVKVPMTARDKAQAIAELTQLLGSAAGLSDVASLNDAVWQREQTRTTGIGHGIAIPHGKAVGVDQLRMAIGRPPEPIEFGAVDSKPVDLIFLLVSPQDQTGPHIQALAKLSRLLTDEHFREALKQAADADELYELIVQHESKAAV